MAALINIAGAVPIHDPAYRYKMPKLQVKVEGRGNGIKTVLLNVDDLGLALKRDPAEVTKFFGCELGAQTTFTDRAIVNGAHRDADLQQHLCKYIDNFVLCRNCRYPETHYRVKDEIIDQKCLACGHRETVDMTHKLCTFILGNYKRAKDAAKAAEKAEKKKEKKSGEAHANGESDKVKEKKEKKEKKDKKEKKEKKEKKDKKESKDNGLASSSSDDEAPDTVFANMTLKDRARKAVSTPSPMPDTDRNSEDVSSDDESPGKNDSDEEESEAQVLGK
jgi:translation initiation factor 5